MHHHLAPRLALAALGLTLAACASPDFKGGGGDSSVTPAEDGVNSCTGTERRCFSNALQECKGGTFATVTTCQATQACTPALGCVACDPAGTVCVGDDVHSCNSDGTVGAAVKSCGVGETCAGGSCSSGGCDASAKVIYVIDDANKLLKLNPSGGKYDLEPVAMVNCPAGPGLEGASNGPYSMSVDRQGTAWVLFKSGQIFWVNTKTGACVDSGHKVGTGGLQLFGMGFVTEKAGSTKEKLYLAGGDTKSKGSQLSVLAPENLAVTSVGDMTSAEQSPELTGTGNGGLYAYYPGATKTWVAEIDPVTAKEKQTWQLQADGDNASAWAFAHWGGKFYIFTTGGVFGTGDTRMLRLDPSTGKTETLVAKVPYRIVGAGVSTCAPTLE